MESHVFLLDVEELGQGRGKRSRHISAEGQRYGVQEQLRHYNTPPNKTQKTRSGKKKTR
jgi:hypothetical protein